jgi:hypothetical protein
MVMAVNIAVAGSLTAASPAQAAARHGCPDLLVCIYLDGDWSNHRPKLLYKRLGSYNQSQMFGVKKIVNNGSSWVKLCTGRNGVNCRDVVAPYFIVRVDFTPINSIALVTNPL